MSDSGEEWGPFSRHMAEGACEVFCNMPRPNNHAPRLLTLLALTLGYLGWLPVGSVMRRRYFYSRNAIVFSPSSSSSDVNCLAVDSSMKLDGSIDVTTTDQDETLDHEAAKHLEDEADILEYNIKVQAKLSNSDENNKSFIADDMSDGLSNTDDSAQSKDTYASVAATGDVIGGPESKPSEAPRSTGNRRTSIAQSVQFVGGIHRDVHSKLIFACGCVLVVSALVAYYVLSAEPEAEDYCKLEDLLPYQLLVYLFNQLETSC